MEALELQMVWRFWCAAKPDLAEGGFGGVMRAKCHVGLPGVVALAASEADGGDCAGSPGGRGWPGSWGSFCPSLMYSYPLYQVFPCHNGDNFNPGRFGMISGGPGDL